MTQSGEDGAGGSAAPWLGFGTMMAPKGPGTQGLGVTPRLSPRLQGPGTAGSRPLPCKPQGMLCWGGVLLPHSRGARLGLPAAPSTGVRGIYGSVPRGSFCSSLDL